MERITMELPIELLETDDYKEFRYYNHSKYPIFVDVEIENNIIHCHVFKMFKMQITKELKKESKVLNKMSNEQVEQYVLDVIEIFLKK